MKKLFIAYPAEPALIGQTIEQAKSDADKYGPNIELTTWRRSDLGGQPLIAPIIEAIKSSDVVAADISRLNFNVTYELGYAIGLGKRGLPIVTKALNTDEQLIYRIGIYDTLIYQSYASSGDLLEQLAAADAGRRIATEYPIDPLPLYVVLPPVMTDDANQLLIRGTRAGLRPRKFDPAEQARLSDGVPASKMKEASPRYSRSRGPFPDGLRRSMETFASAGWCSGHNSLPDLRYSFWRASNDIHNSRLEG